MRIVIALAAAIVLAAYLTRVSVREHGPAAVNPPQAAAQPARVPAQPVPSGSQNDPPAPVTAPLAVPSAPVDAGVEKALRARVTAYWGARSRSNLLAAYPYYEPSFRARYSSEQFLETFQRLLRFRPRFQALERVHFEPDRRSARVAVRLRTRPEVLLGEELVSVSEETWRLVGGTWYREGDSLLPTF